jgi:hypothetical protein
MTRVNVGYPVKHLTRAHLIAEHREIKRIPNMVASGRAKLSGIPSAFTLGTGHVKFFYDKLGYLLKRYREIYSECISRGYNVQDYSDAWDKVPSNLMGEWSPTEKDAQIIKERIAQRLAK